MGCQKELTLEWLSMLILNFLEMIREAESKDKFEN